MQRISKKQHIRSKSGLYRLVFEFLPTRIFVAFLFSILLLQPVGHAKADEGTSTQSAPEAEQATPTNAETADPSQPVAVSTPTDQQNQTNVQDGEQTTADAPTTASVSSSTDATNQDKTAIGEDPSAATTTALLNENLPQSSTSSSPSGSVLGASTIVGTSTQVETSSTTLAATSSATTSVTQSTDTQTEIQATSSGTTVLQQTTDTATTSSSRDTAAESNASSTTTVQEQNVATSTGTSVEFSDLNRYQFGAQECASVGEGAYYCSKQNDPSLTPESDGVYAAPDSDGDSEIFIKLHGKTTQITHNTLEDKEPYYDPVSNTVVWHRLIDGRYEIMQYDLAKGTETQITHNDVNDMEPTASGDYIVWQRWVNDNWEIMLYDGHAEKQITHNDTHDIAPHIKGGYVIWHATGVGGNAYIGVYEIATGLTSMIEDQDGGKVENPRFVLVYDTTYDNGDIVTKGYDFESKSVVPLSALPHQAPQHLPNPDATGETRALVQSQSGSVKGVVEGTSTPSSGSGEPPSGDSLASTTAAFATSTIDASSTPLSNASSTQDIGGAISASTTIDMQATSSAPLQLDEYDVVVPAFAPASSTQELNSTTTPDFVE